MSNKAEERRVAILGASIKLLSDRGLAGLTHRAADAAAGLPQGSTTYYFPKKAALMRAVATHLAQELEKDCDDLQVAFAGLAAVDGIEAAIDHVAQSLVASVEDAKQLFLARIELTLAAARDPELADVGNRLADAGRRPIEFYVNLITKETDQALIDTCVGVIDGIALMYATGQAAQPTVAQVTSVLRSLVSVDRGQPKP